LNEKLSSKISSEGTTSPISCHNCVALSSFKIETCVSFEKFPIDMIFAKLSLCVLHGIADSIYGCDVLHRHIVFVILVLVVFLAIVCNCMTIASVF